MKKIFKKKGTLIIIIFASIMIYAFGCDSRVNEYSKSENFIYKGHSWDVIQLNDSTFVVIPGLNAKKNSKPIMITKLIDWTSFEYE